MPYAKGERRLAIQVEDHPVSYIDFEGTIPKGQYGDGTVMVWDHGTFDPDDVHPAKQLAKGKLHFSLTGKKLRGQWYLVRMSDPKQWLIVKGESGIRPITREADDTSAVTGRSMADIAAGGETKASDGLPVEKKRGGKRPSRRSPRTRRATSNPTPEAVPAFVEPMKALLVDGLPSGNWLYEVKFDGFRALASKSGDEIFLFSRNNKDFSQRFPEVVTWVSELEADGILLDGEIVALDKEGRSSFQALQAYQMGEEKPPIFYYVFDLLFREGADLRSHPLGERKALLKKIPHRSPVGIRFSPSLEGEPDALVMEVRKLGLEGLLAKRKDSVYETGRRSGAWLKVKFNLEQEFVIGGFTQPGGSRTHLGALLVGVREGKEWIFTGKVGTGFSQATLALVHRRLTAVDAQECPFSNLPQTRRRRFGQAMTSAELRRCHWVKPQLVAQIKFAGWTRDGMLRHPVFLGFRDDKNALEVVREGAQSK